jgi:hypothetical protein
MAEVANDLIYGVLKPIQAEIRSLKDDNRDVRLRLASPDERLLGLAHTLNATQTDIANIYTKANRTDRRIERIERRLDIEEPAE